MGVIQTLTYNKTARRWEGNINPNLLIWMTDETFHQYVRTYYEGHPDHISYEQAVERCKQVSYWAYWQYDRNIHVVSLGMQFGKERGHEQTERETLEEGRGTYHGSGARP